MSFSKSLERVADNGAYPPGGVVARWGQLMRATPFIAGRLAQLTEAGSLNSLGDLGTIHSGVVTRANGFFLVRELAFDEIPRRMHVTRGDMRRIAVISDAMGVLQKIERTHLKPVIKGPEQLESAFSIRRSPFRLLDVKMTKDELTQNSHTGVLAYLNRGETVEYRTSEDSLKGGIPAQRSQVKNRRPHWYSLQGIRHPRTRIVVPEHIDRRYVFTLVPATDEGVVIDTLYVYEPYDEQHAAFIHAAMNSLLTWYQVELRGRSQHGEGVLKVKLPDYRGIAVCCPTSVSQEDRQAVLGAFSRLERVAAGPSLEELGEPQRTAFEEAYLKACGFTDPQQAAMVLEQDLRALSGERLERRLSVAEAKVSRRKATNVVATTEAYAARVAGAMSALPDPQQFVRTPESCEPIAIEGPVEGEIRVGSSLFDNGTVQAGEATVARTSSPLAAEMVRAVLLIDRNANNVRLPRGRELEQAHRQWTHAAQQWHAQFEAEFARVMGAVTDPRVRQTVRSTALRTLKAIQ